MITPPWTRRIGASIDRLMCITMCTPKCGAEYFPNPEFVARRTTSHPAHHSSARPAGHGVPRRRSVITIAR